MNSALKSSFNIFLSRLSNAGAIYLLFVVIGYINNSALGEFNVYLSFIGIFDGLAVITLIYFQNEASRMKKHTLLFAKGLQIAILLGSCVAILSSSVVYFQFNNSPLFMPMLLTTLTYPILSSVAFMSYYLEGINKANIVSQMHLIASFLQVLSFEIGVICCVGCIYCIFCKRCNHAVRFIDPLKRICSTNEEYIVKTRHLSLIKKWIADVIGSYHYAVRFCFGCHCN